MIKDFENIVKDTFEHFEADVNPQAWTNIQQGLQATPPAGNTTGGNAVSAAVKTATIFGQAGSLITIAGIIALTAIGAWYILSDKKENKKSEVVVPVTSPSQREISNSVPDPGMTSNQVTDNHRTELKPLKSSIKRENTNKENKVATVELNSGNASKEIKKETSIQKSEEVVKEASIAAKSSTSNPGIKNTEPVVTKNDNAQQQEASKLITTYKNEPAAYIVANPISGNAPLTVSFLNNGYAKNINWDFGTGNTEDHNNQTSFTFKTPGIYIVRLTATSQDNIVYTDEIKIEVKGSETTGQSSIAEIQNVFTPNGDGYNDVFKIKGNNLVSVNAAIFNASGNQVYQWSDPEGGWDGKINRNGIASEGTYFYIIDAKGKDGKTYHFKGAVSLIK